MNQSAKKYKTMDGCIFIQDTATGLYLAYDSQTGLIIWVSLTNHPYCFQSQSLVDIVLALLNTPKNPTQYVGRPGDRGGHS